MKEFQPENPDFFNPYQIVNEGDIIPDIKPPFPMESKELYRKISGADAAQSIKRGIEESVKVKEFFKPFSGQIIVEIGPGDAISGYNIALLSGAKGYVGIEPYYYVDCLKKFVEHDVNSLGKKSARIPHTVVEADALSFLKRLPDKSVSVFASQLERVMKNGYNSAVAQEIQRVLHSQGAFIEYDSTFRLDKGLFSYDLFDQKLDEDAHLAFELEKYQLKK